MSFLRAIMLNRFAGSKDPTWDYVFIAEWNAIEINSAILVSCLIVLKPLFRKLVPRLFTASDQGPMLERAYGETGTPGGDASGADIESQSSSGKTGHAAGEGQRS